MSNSPSDKEFRSSGFTVPSFATHIGPIVVDCSTWDAVEGEDRRPSQTPVSAAVNLGSFILDFIEPKAIEIVMNVSECASKEAAFQLALDMIYSVTQAAPDLKLLYDPERTRQEEGKVTIVLTPQVYLKDDERLKEVVKWINSNPKIGPGEVLGQHPRQARILASAA